MNMEFLYDDIQSSHMGINIVRLNSGFFSSPAFGMQDVVEQESAIRSNPYFVRTRKQPIEFEVVMSPLEKEWTPQLRQKIFQWLVRDTYTKFQTTDDLGKMYYALPMNAGDIFTNGSNQGYITIMFRTNAYHAWTPPYYNYFDLSDNESTEEITLYNYSNIQEYFYYYPKIQITSTEGLLPEVPISLKNLSHSTPDFEIYDLFQDEVVAFDNDKRILKSSMEDEGYYRFKDFNGKWLKLVYGQNKIQVAGKCILEVKSQFPIVR